MKYLLDTNAVIALLGGQALVVHRVRQVSQGEIALSALVMHELYYGAYKGVRTQQTLLNYERLRFEVLPFDEQDALRSGEVRSSLERSGKPIGPNDTLIAGQALARDLTLVTRNTREFMRVSGLRLENWEA